MLPVQLCKRLLSFANRQRLAERLRRDDVGPWQPYLIDTLPRRLYWSGLLRRSDDHRHLVWRCAAICDAVQTILEP